MDILAKIAEERIREAIKKGEFDNLSLKGKPLKLEDLSRVSEELRAGYKILKNAGVLPEELELKKEIISLKNLIACCYEDEEKKLLKKKLNEKILRFNILMEKRGVKGSAVGLYRSKIYKKLEY